MTEQPAVLTAYGLYAELLSVDPSQIDIKVERNVVDGDTIAASSATDGSS